MHGFCTTMSLSKSKPLYLGYAQQPRLVMQSLLPAICLHVSKARPSDTGALKQLPRVVRSTLAPCSLCMQARIAVCFACFHQTKMLLQSFKAEGTAIQRKLLTTVATADASLSVTECQAGHPPTHPPSLLTPRHFGASVVVCTTNE
jgi:hypothetical protein